VAIDFTTDIGKIRALTGDVGEEIGFIMSDDEITVILANEGGILLLGAAGVLEVMATKQAIISQKIKTMDLSTDGPAVAKSLLDRAKLMREQYALSTENEGTDFELIEMIFNQAQRDAWYLKQIQRGMVY
jgi:hypothetical protein